MNKIYDAYGRAVAATLDKLTAVLAMQLLVDRGFMVIQKPEADFLRDVIAHGMDKQT